MSVNATILVVDDDESVRRSLQRILTRAGYEVEAVQTAEDALERLAGRSFDLVLTDLQMPGMNGLQLLAEIKQLAPQLPVVMITGHADADVVIQALRHGVSDFMPKPYQPEELLTIVARESGRHKPASVVESAPAVFSRQLSPAQLDEIDRILAELRAEAAARCVLLVEGSGYVVDAKGVIEDINVAALAALMAGDFAATSGIASLIGEGEAFRLNYHEGSRYSVYSANLASDLFLLVVFGQDVRSGMVLYATRQILPQLTAIIEQSVPLSAGETGQAGEAGQNEHLFSLDEIMQSGLLGDQALDAFDEHFKTLWQ